MVFFGVEHFLHPEFAPGVPLPKLMPALDSGTRSLGLYYRCCPCRLRTEHPLQEASALGGHSFGHRISCFRDLYLPADGDRSSFDCHQRRT
jgi:hypothetical protein